MFNWFQSYYYRYDPHGVLNIFEDDDFQSAEVFQTQPGYNVNSKEDNGDLESCLNATVDYDIPTAQDEGLSKNNDLFCHAHAALGDDE